MNRLSLLRLRLQYWQVFGFYKVSKPWNHVPYLCVSPSYTNRTSAGNDEKSKFYLRFKENAILAMISPALSSWMAWMLCLIPLWSSHSFFMFLFWWGRSWSMKRPASSKIRLPMLIQRVSVIRRDDVPNFGPKLPEPTIFGNAEELRQYILLKRNLFSSCWCLVIAGEYAAYKAPKLSKPLQKARRLMFEDIVKMTIDINDLSQSMPTTSLGSLLSRGRSSAKKSLPEM